MKLNQSKHLLPNPPLPPLPHPSRPPPPPRIPPPRLDHHLMQHEMKMEEIGHNIFSLGLRLYDDIAELGLAEVVAEAAVGVQEGV